MSAPLCAVLHIGTRKTGTSTVQALLASNADRLRQAGAVVPPPGLLRPNGFELAYAAARGRKLDVYRTVPWFPGHEETIARGERAIERTARAARDAGASRFVLSAEDLSVLDRPAVDRLCAMLRPHVERVIVLCALRAQERYLASNVATEVRTGAADDPDALFERFADGVHYRLDYRAMLDDWDAGVAEAGLGENAVSAWLYEEGVAPDRVVAEVLSRAGVPRSTVPDGPTATLNAAMSRGGLAALARFNRWERARPEELNAQQRQALIWTASRLERAGDSERWAPSPAAVQAVRERFAGSNEVLRGQRFPNRPAPLFPPPPNAAQPSPHRPDHATVFLDALVPAIGALLDERRGAQARYRMERGRALALGGDPSAAIEHFEAALRLAPDLGPAALPQLAQALAATGRVREACDRARELVAQTEGTRGAGLLRTLERRLSEPETPN